MRILSLEQRKIANELQDWVDSGEVADSIVLALGDQWGCKITLEMGRRVLERLMKELPSILEPIVRRIEPEGLSGESQWTT